MCTPGTGVFWASTVHGVQGWRGRGWPMQCLCSLQCTDRWSNKKKEVQLLTLPFSVLDMVFIIDWLPMFNIWGMVSNNNTHNNKSSNSHKHFLLLSFIIYLRQNPGILPVHSKTSSQLQPPLFMDSRVTTRRGAGAKPEGAGRAQQSVCHCDNLLKGGGQGIIK